MKRYFQEKPTRNEQAKGLFSEKEYAKLKIQNSTRKKSSGLILQSLVSYLFIPDVNGSILEMTTFFFLQIHFYLDSLIPRTQNLILTNQRRVFIKSLEGSYISDTRFKKLAFP